MADSRPQDAQWWVRRKDDPTSPHEIILNIHEQLKPHINLRKELARKNAKQYGVDLSQLGIQDPDPTGGVLAFNQAENVLDTIVAKTTKNRVVPMAVTVGGTRSQRMRAKEFNRYIAGMFDDCDVYAKDIQWVTDALLFEEAICRVMPDYENKTIVFDRCIPYEVNSDPYESRYGSPRCIYQHRFIDRLVLKGMFEDDKKLLKIIDRVSQSNQDDDFFAMPRASDMVMVFEAWHLPSSKKAKDGRYVMCVKEGMLIDEEYEENHFPFAYMYRKPPVVGIHGQSLMTNLRIAQEELDNVTEKIQEGYAVFGQTKIFVPRGANLKKSEMDDEIGSFIEFDGPQPPQEWAATPVNPQVLDYRNLVKSDMVETSGVNQMSTQGQIPEGITAARAIQMVEDTESERLGPFWKSRERFYVKLAELGLDAARALAKENSGFVVRSMSNKRFLKPLRIEDVDIDINDYRVQVFPTSLLSRSPVAKYDQLSEMRARGDINPQEFRRLIDMPDLDAESDLDTSSIEIVDSCIEGILEKGLAFSAEPFDDHALIIQRGSKAYNLARVQAPEDKKELKVHNERLRNLRTYIVSAQKFLQPPPTANIPPNPLAPPPGMPGMPGPMPPAPPPVAPGAVQPLAPPGQEYPVPLPQ